jgi:hypothetical protein
VTDLQRFLGKFDVARFDALLVRVELPQATAAARPRVHGTILSEDHSCAAILMRDREVFVIWSAKPPVANLDGVLPKSDPRWFHVPSPRRKLRKSAASSWAIVYSAVFAEDDCSVVLFATLVCNRKVCAISISKTPLTELDEPISDFNICSL